MHLAHWCVDGVLEVSELYLIRHGQASFGADNYDQLSPLGWQQAEWLGAYFAERQISFDRIVVGEHRRQQQTTEGIMRGARVAREPEVHCGFNEYDFTALYQAYIGTHPKQQTGAWQGADRRGFYSALKEALRAWIGGTLDPNLSETWEAFRFRVSEALQIALGTTRSGQCVAVVSSAGPISVVIGEILNLSAGTIVDLNFNIGNTSILTFTCPTSLKADLDRYATLHAQTYGEAVDAIALIPYMLEAFIARDRGFKTGEGSNAARGRSRRQDSPLS